ncbi:MAG: hypothetical protein methR_P2286 [Methyloprofundus sp.]|nr:MAG: hypothetical protein methR_P2286 [Methyloprofundus sp.]
MNVMTYPKVPMSPLSVNEELDSCLQTFLAKGHLSVEQKLAFYNDKVQGLLHEYLIQVYPMCHQLAGGQYFTQIVQRYTAQFPADSLDLNKFSESFPAFVHVQSMQLSELQVFPHLKEMARIEYIQYQVYFAEQRAEFDFNAFYDLGEHQYAEVTFVLAADIGFISSSYAVAHLWKMQKKTKHVREKLVPKEVECYCIVRHIYTVELIKVDANLYDLLVSIAKGESMAAIYKFDQEGYLLELIKSGWVCGFELGGK